MAEPDGTPNAEIGFFTSEGYYNGHIMAKQTSISSDFSISALQPNALAKLQCAMFIGCSTGVSYNGYNLVDATFNKGAHFALGTTQTTYTPQTNKWTKKFFEKAATGATIKQCMDHANYYQNIGALYYKGDIFTKLK